MSRVFSLLLSTRENGLLFNLIGQDCNALAAAVVQLYLATSAGQAEGSKWEGHGCGVVCLVQDRVLHSTFLRLYSVRRPRLLWEQELYSPFVYSAPRPFFHTFPADECQAGLSFADEEEAERFLTAVQKCIMEHKAQPTLFRVHSLECASGWLLKDKLERSHDNSPSEFKSVLDTMRNTTHVSVKNDPGTDTETVRPVLELGEFTAASSVSLENSAPETNPRVQTINTSQSCSSPPTLPRLNEASLSLALRKGPLPPVPVTGRLSRSSSVQSITVSSLKPLPDWVPPPPSVPAPTAPPTFVGIRKSASFAPERDSLSTPVVKRLYSLHIKGETEVE